MVPLLLSSASALLEPAVHAIREPSGERKQLYSSLFPPYPWLVGNWVNVVAVPVQFTASTLSVSPVNLPFWSYAAVARLRLMPAATPDLIERLAPVGRTDLCAPSSPIQSVGHAAFGARRDLASLRAAGTHAEPTSSASRGAGRGAPRRLWLLGSRGLWRRHLRGPAQVPRRGPLRTSQGAGRGRPADAADGHPPWADARRPPPPPRRCGRGLCPSGRSGRGRRLPAPRSAHRRAPPARDRQLLRPDRPGLARLPGSPPGRGHPRRRLGLPPGRWSGLPSRGGGDRRIRRHRGRHGDRDGGGHPGRPLPRRD